MLGFHNIRPGKTPLLVTSAIYSYTGSDQYLVVPENTKYVVVSCWGAGGGAKGIGTAYSFGTGDGGGGGYTSATFGMNPSANLKIIVGQGGTAFRGDAPSTSIYGGGGTNDAVNDSFGTAAGGGRSAVQVCLSLSNKELITAGGGGGGGGSIGSQNTTYNTDGGPGGGLTGGDAGDATYGGKGGSQSAGGDSGDTQYSFFAPPTSGSQLQGGSGGSYGCGGGGGYYGGGGGSFNNPLQVMFGGGGGSSYVNSTYQTSGSTSTIEQGSGRITANSEAVPSPYRSLVGNGGSKAVEQAGNSGQDGIVIIQCFASPSWVASTFITDCSSLIGWTNSGFAVSTVGSQTCFYATSGYNYIYMDTFLPSFNGKTISFQVYLTGGCPDFLFGCNSAGAGQILRFEQRSGPGTGFNTSDSWTAVNYPTNPDSYYWTQNTWLQIVITISSAGSATFSVDGVDSGFYYTITNNGGYIGIMSDGGGGSIAVNNIVIE